MNNKQILKTFKVHGGPFRDGALLFFNVMEKDAKGFKKYLKDQLDVDYTNYVHDSVDRLQNLRGFEYASTCWLKWYQDHDPARLNKVREFYDILCDFLIEHKEEINGDLGNAPYLAIDNWRVHTFLFKRIIVDSPVSSDLWRWKRLSELTKSHLIYGLKIDKFEDTIKTYNDYVINISSKNKAILTKGDRDGNKEEK